MDPQNRGFLSTWCSSVLLYVWGPLYTYIHTPLATRHSSWKIAPRDRGARSPTMSHLVGSDRSSSSVQPAQRIQPVHHPTRDQERLGAPRGIGRVQPHVHAAHRVSAYF
jgi:hypothetical protein